MKTKVSAKVQAVFCYFNTEVSLFVSLFFGLWSFHCFESLLETDTFSPSCHTIIPPTVTTKVQNSNLHSKSVRKCRFWNLEARVYNLVAIHFCIFSHFKQKSRKKVPSSLDMCLIWPLVLDRSLLIAIIMQFLDMRLEIHKDYDLKKWIRD